MNDNKLQKNKDLAIKAKNSRDEYKEMNMRYMNGKATLDEVMEKKKKFEKIERNFRKNTKGSIYKSIEDDLKKKYGKK